MWHSMHRNGCKSVLLREVGTWFSLKWIESQVFHASEIFAEPQYYAASNRRKQWAEKIYFYLQIKPQ
jgi:hypothetical protein